MTLQFAISEAKRRTRELGTTQHVYPSLFEKDEYIVASREVRRGLDSVYTAYPDGSELEY